MIKVLRNIRKMLLAEGKTTRYLKYAIGEILLVMIGILLALQVNNWNENRKLKLEELKILKELRAEVKRSIEELDIVASYNEKSVERLMNMRDHINMDLPYEKSLDTAFGILDIWNMPYLPFTAYESLKSKGIERITNDSLRSSITEIYEFQMKYLLDDSGRWEWSFNANTTQRMMVRHVRRFDGLEENDLARPNDFEALKQDDEFRNFLNVLIPIRNDHTSALKYVSQGMSGLLEKLNAEIESFEQ